MVKAGNRFGLTLALVASFFASFLAAPRLHAQAEQPASEEPGPSTLLQSRAEGVVSVLNGQTPPDEVFDASFLMAVSPAMLSAMNQQLSAQFGALEGVEKIEVRDATSGTVTFRFERAAGTGPLTIAPSPPYKIIGLQLSQFKASHDNVDSLRSELAALPGDVGVLFAPLDSPDTPVLSLNPDRQFAIGSTFKLYILSALARSVEEGERKWNDVLTLDRASFPSGQMHNWPKGAPVTLHTLATMMISISDNTATDILLHALGRSTVEAELKRIGHSAPARTLPFLSTLELFGLKGSDTNMRRYIKADEAGRRLILADFEDDVAGDPTRIEPPRFAKPTAIDTLEWFASGRDLEKLARRLSEIRDPVVRQIMSVSKGLPEGATADWAYVGYKGGSEPGVLNLTWLLQSEQGRYYVLAMSWNNPDAVLNHSTFEFLAQRILDLAE